MTISKSILIIGVYDKVRSSMLGIGYIHSYLESKHFQVKSIFLNKKSQSTNALLSTIIETEPYIIGIQIIAENRGYCFQLIETIHQFFPQIQLVLGGPIISGIYNQLLFRYPYIIILLGEGEETFVDIANTIYENKPLDNIKNIAFHKNGHIVKTSPRSLIQNLDQLPFPKHQLFLDNNETGLSILTSRGCPFNCSFCCAHETRDIRFRSIGNIIQELKYIKRSFPSVSTIRIIDSDFLIDNQRVVHFCKEVILNNLKYKYICSGRFSTLSMAMLKKMEEAGFIMIGFGLESANDNIREKAQKKLTKTDVVQSVQLLAKTKINIYINLIVGLPGETWSTIKETGLFIQKLQKIKYIYYIGHGGMLANVYPNTRLYEKMQSVGAIQEKDWLTNTSEFFYTLEHDHQTLINMRKELLSYISVLHFFTIKGFYRQWHIVLFSSSRIKILCTILKIYFPNTINTIKRIIKFQKSYSQKTKKC